jgi:hypothetical protein
MSGDSQNLELAIQSMRHALRDIANYGDCLHSEHHGDPGCTCPVCVAKKALATEDAIDWRFVSHMDYRRATMPRERDMVEAWKAYLKRAGTGPDSRPDLVLSQIIGDAPSVRDWYVATSVLQWLATNCGMSVLEAAGFKYDWDRGRSR